MTRKLTILLFALMLSATSVYAQGYYGQNKMAYEKLDKFYETEHFLIYHSLDLNDPNQKRHFETQVIHPLENAYRFYSNLFGHSLKDKTPVLVYKSHSGFEGNYVIDSPFYKHCEIRKRTWKSLGVNAIFKDDLPEGVGAFAEPTRNRIVLKLDFLPPLNATIIAHELGHRFQFDMLKVGLFGRLINFSQLPPWFMEGGADYWADVYNPYTRDDIRGINQRSAGGNPEKYLPTWSELNNNEGDAYSMGAMVFKFIEGKFGKDIVLDFYRSKLKNKQGGNILQTLSEVLNNKNNKDKLNVASQASGNSAKSNLAISPNTFDRLHREYWTSIYAKDARERPTPYGDNHNFKGWSVVPDSLPYPTVSVVPSCDGTKIFALSVQKSTVSVISFRPKGDSEEILSDPNASKVVNITPNFPPKPVEYLVAQELNVWPFNGSDFTVSCDGKRVAVMGRVGRDHALTIWDVEKREMLEAIDLGLDQAFSPFFSSDGKKIYFSASKNITRNIYVIDLESRNIRNLTGVIYFEGVGKASEFNSFDSAPAVSHDGTKLAYVRFEGDFQKLILLDLLTGNKEQLTFGRYNDNSPSWSEDDKTILYTSDKELGIWNVYTFDLETRTTSQRTNLFGGAFTPKYVPGKSDQIYYSAYWQYDQYGSYIYPNFEVVRAELRTPVATYRANEDRSENMDFAFKIDDLFQIESDKNQLLNPKKAPKNFKLYGSNASFGHTQYFGFWGGATFALTNMLETEQYFFRTVSYGSFKIYDGAYLNQQNRLNWGYSLYYQKLPLRYAYYQPTFNGSKYPAQIILNQTWTSQSGADFFASYPLSKFSRIEGATRVKRKTFLSEYGLSSDLVRELELSEYFTADDLALLNLYERSNGSSVSFVAAYVKDTGIDSGNTWGPLNGDRFRAQVEFAPPLSSKLLSYTTLSADARKYFCLGQCQSSLFAVRGNALYSTNPTSGEVIINDIDQLRGFPYGSYIGNQSIYGSAELRFPLAELAVNFLGYMPIRGILFIDGGYSRFNDNKFPGQRGVSVGGVIQLPLMGVPFNYAVSFTNKDGFKDKKMVTYLGFSW